MFRIPSFVLNQLYASDSDPGVVFTSRYKYLLYRNAVDVGFSCYDLVQRISLSDSGDCLQRLLLSGFYGL